MPSYLGFHTFGQAIKKWVNTARHPKQQTYVYIPDIANRKQRDSLGNQFTIRRGTWFWRHEGGNLVPFPETIADILEKNYQALCSRDKQFVTALVSMDENTEIVLVREVGALGSREYRTDDLKAQPKLVFRGSAMPSGVGAHHHASPGMVSASYSLDRGDLVEDLIAKANSVEALKRIVSDKLGILFFN